jgi:tetratricopeptide (TPR) repeat protein
VSHVTDQDLRLFVDRRLDAASRRAVLLHLLSGCLVCRERSARFLPPEDFLPPLPWAVDESVYDDVIDRCRARLPDAAARVRSEREAGERFLAALRPLDLPAEEVLTRAGLAISRRGSAALPHRACVDALLTLSFEERARDPERMLDLACAAQTVLSMLVKNREECSRYTPAEIADLQARTWGELANAHRVNENHSAAEEALREAATARAAGSDDPLLLARLFDVEASLRTDLRRFDEAARLLDRVYSLYHQIGESHLAGRALIKRGIGLHYEGEWAEAVAMLRQALTLLDGDRDPQLLVVCRQHLLFSMAANGEYTEAAALLLKSGLREAFADEPLNRLKVRWLEGRIYAGLGKPQRAETALEEARQGFLAAGVDYEAALVNLELAGVLAAQGRLGEVEELAGEALETFEILEIGAEAEKAVRYLHEAFLTRQATAALVRDVVHFLERLDRQPLLRFQAR